jgi:protein SCO1
VSAPFSRTVQWLVWGGLGAVIMAVVGLYAWKLSQPREAPLPVLGVVRPFSLTNQLGQAVSMAELQERVWVANVVFTRCAGPCARLTRQMREVQDAFQPGAPVRFVSFTADPEFDQPPVLLEYGQRFGADAERWFFLTGSQREIYRLAMEDLKFVVMETDPETRQPDEDLFIHSTRFVVVDGRGQIRAYVDGDEPDSPRQIEKAVRRLLREG